MNRESLIKYIIEAFDNVEQPQDITLHVAEAHDSYDYEHDHEHRKNDYFGRWQDIPQEHIHNCQSALCYVDKIGMRFYLPAYMVWYLKNLGTSEVWSDHTLYSLDNNADNPQLSEYHKDRFSLFNREQLRACALFVKYCATNEAEHTDCDFAQKKFDRYWSQYEKI